MARNIYEIPRSVFDRWATGDPHRLGPKMGDPAGIGFLCAGWVSRVLITGEE